MRKSILTSDTHFGNENFTKSREELYIDFIDNVVLNDTELDRFYSVGDTFELPYDMLQKVIANKRLRNKVNEASEHVKFYVIVGNHDIGLQKMPDFKNHFPHLHIGRAKKKKIVLREEVGNETKPKMAVETITSGKDIVLYGKRMHIAHGYEYDHYFSKNPARFHSLIKLINSLQDKLGPNIDDWVLDSYSAIREMLGADPEVIENRRELHLAARDLAQYRVCNGSVRKRTSDAELDFVIFGHTHWQEKKRLYDEVLLEEKPLKSEYVNTGCWLETPKYKGSDFTVIQEDGMIKNFKYEDMVHY